MHPQVMVIPSQQHGQFAFVQWMPPRHHQMYHHPARMGYHGSIGLLGGNEMHQVRNAQQPIIHEQSVQASPLVLQGHVVEHPG